MRTKSAKRILDLNLQPHKLEPFYNALPGFLNVVSCFNNNFKYQLNLLAINNTSYFQVELILQMGYEPDYFPVLKFSQQHFL